MKYIIIKISSFLCLSLASCALLYPARTPMDSVRYITGNEQSKNLLVLLPGRGEKLNSYLKHGFINALKESGADFDAQAVDAQLGYYYQENLIPRLYEDVIKPAKHDGYENIWLFGISLGGLGTLWYGKDKGETINGIIAIAPFVGDRDVIDEIIGAGGPTAWTQAEPAAEGDYQRPLWAWLKKYSAKDNNLPKLILGYGLEDEFARGNNLLAEMLPAEQVFTLPGGHDWDTWRRLFNAILNLLKTNKCNQ